MQLELVAFDLIICSINSSKNRL